MADETHGRLRADGIFKMLTWDSLVLTEILGLPKIEGPPLQQETYEPAERRLDRFYRLADGSLLNVEHQSTLDDCERLAERMIRYRLRA